MNLKVLNQLANRCQRHLDELARELVAVGLDPVKENVSIVVAAVEGLDELQRRIYAERPDLEYHYDPDRPPTPFMVEIQGLVSRAHEAFRNEDLDQAADLVREAIALEPPSIIMEMLEKTLSDFIYRGPADSGTR